MIRELKSAAAVLTVAAAMSFHPSVADAAFIFNGSFGASNDVQLFNFTVAGPAATSVTMETFNFHAGTGDFAGVTATGGFDPLLTLFNSSGSFITNFTPDIQPGGPNYDSRIQQTLSAGTYYLSLTQYDNFYVSGDILANPTFARSGQPNYTTVPLEEGLGCLDPFIDQACNQRTSAWKVGISGATTAAVIPLPAALPLLATALTGLGVVGWRQRRRQSALG